MVIFGRHFQLCKWGILGVRKGWSALLSSSTYAYEYVCQILYRCKVYFWCKRGNDASYVKKKLILVSMSSYANDDVWGFKTAGKPSYG